MKKWIQKIHLKKGGLHRLLGISAEDKIHFGLINKIMKSEINRVIKNPSRKGRKRIKK